MPCLPPAFHSRAAKLRLLRIAILQRAIVVFSLLNRGVTYAFIWQLAFRRFEIVQRFAALVIASTWRIRRFEIVQRFAAFMLYSGSPLSGCTQARCFHYLIDSG